uniref:Uncharacterized protein n=1 Tax=Globodera rostochiensis TaxID=31243 RepID=A0A914HQ63_GLORO
MVNNNNNISDSMSRTGRKRSQADVERAEATEQKKAEKARRRERKNGKKPNEAAQSHDCARKTAMRSIHYESTRALPPPLDPRLQRQLQPTPSTLRPPVTRAPPYCARQRQYLRHCAHRHCFWRLAASAATACSADPQPPPPPPTTTTTTTTAVERRKQPGQRKQQQRQTTAKKRRLASSTTHGRKTTLNQCRR